MNWYKKSQTQQVISFDFDGTIFMNEWDEADNDYKRDSSGNVAGEVNAGIISLMRDYASSGYRVIIVTSRYASNKGEVERIVKENNLPVAEIVCTSGNLKAPILKMLKALKHYDNDADEINAIKQAGIVEGILV